MNLPFTSAGPLGPQNRRTAVANLPITIAGPRRPLRPQWRIYSSPLMGSSLSMPYIPPHFRRAGSGLRAASIKQNRINHKQPRLQLLACFVPSRNSPVHQVWPVSKPLPTCSLTRLVPAACQWSHQSLGRSNFINHAPKLQGKQTEKVEARKHPTVLVVCTRLLRTLEIARCNRKRWSLWHPRK